jgi:hypothetical protein
MFVLSLQGPLDDLDDQEIIKTEENGALSLLTEALNITSSLPDCDLES